MPIGAADADAQHAYQHFIAARERGLVDLFEPGFARARTRHQRAHHSVLDRNGAPFPSRAGDCIADNRRAVAVLKGSAIWRDAAAASHGLEQVRKLVDKRMLPTDDVAIRPPVAHEWMLRGVRHEQGGEALRTGANLEFVQALQVEAQRAVAAVDLEVEAVFVTRCNTRGLECSAGAGGELNGGGKRIVDRDPSPGPFSCEGTQCGGNGSWFANQKARQVDDMRAKIAKRAAARAFARQ